jgi:glycyl-tRNA synthetase beta chain
MSTEAVDALLVELLVEELPPKSLPRLAQAWGHGLEQALRAQHLLLPQSQATVYATPRRLAVHISSVQAQAPRQQQVMKLMPVKVGLDAQGQPTAALRKKLQAVGAPEIGVEALQRVNDGKNETLQLVREVAGATLLEGLQWALDDTLAKLPIAKVMTYQLHRHCRLPGFSNVRFVRPAHGLVALHGKQVVPVQALGLQAGDCTLGHRFESLVPVLKLAHANDYASQLAEYGAVIASFEERRASIDQQLHAAAERAGLQVLGDDDLLNEVTALVERPHVLTCSFDPAFLQVPAACLVLTMKANQKYFPLVDASGGLSHRFLVVSNLTPADPSAIVTGNERVIRPRLADAKFFFDQDRKQPLLSRLPRLEHVVYHDRLGSQAQRSARVQAIACAVAQRMQPPVDAAEVALAARLAKADLLTDMVAEFPELQGIMGAQYAAHDGHSQNVAQAIEDHYRPRFAGDELPRGQVGVALALADKMETLVGMFGIGNLPTGDKDPFALRRHALGVLRLIAERAPTLQWPDLLAITAAAFEPDTLDHELQPLTDFVYERLAGSLREQGWRTQEVDAVLAPRPAGLAEVPARLQAVRAFGDLPSGAALAAANKRIGNVLRKAEDVSQVEVNPSLLGEAAEQALHQAMEQTLPAAQVLADAHRWSEQLAALAVLREPVDAFFDGVLVNASDPALRVNRLALLQQLHRAMNQVADLSRLAQ